MKKILLVLTGTGTPDQVIDYAVNEAKKRALGLAALFVHDDALENEVFDTFTDIGFIGDKPTTELSESLMKEYRQRGYEEIGRVQIKAMEQAVDFEPLMAQGQFVKTVLEMTEKTDASLVVLFKRKKRDFLKYFSRSIVDEVREKASCEVVVFKEDA